MMEGTRHRGRWNKKAPLDTRLLLICMLIPTLSSSQPSEQVTCARDEYPHTAKTFCCNKCSAGYKLVEQCQAAGRRSNCTTCPEGQFTDQMNAMYNCRGCTICKENNHELVESPCKTTQNTICKCMEGYYKSKIDSITFECLRCTKCGNNEKETQACTSKKNTVCECMEKYYKVRKKCEPCKNCSVPECKHLCSPVYATKDPKPEKEFHLSIIVGVAAVALVMLALGIIVTHMTTKWVTKRQLQPPITTKFDDSQDSHKVLIQEDMSVENSSVKPITMQSRESEQQPTNLPDCVPLEIQIPDLIYTVLELVPVLQVKQLVRTLGVKDTEIEQAELDHRSCREAHYQMLRVWAERASRAGGEGRGRMLPRPLLQELLDKLRNMHLGWAAEELETKYPNQ